MCPKLSQGRHLIASEVCDSKVGVANGLDLAHLEKEREGGCKGMQAAGN
jgi:hypothetical protein